MVFDSKKVEIPPPKSVPPNVTQRTLRMCLFLSCGQ